MLSLADELRMLPLFQRVPASAVSSAAALWSVRTLHVGEVLWRAGAPVEEIGIVLAGDLRAMLNEGEVGRVLPGEVVGEASGFFPGSLRSASLVAKSPSTVALLPVSGLRTLRWQRSPMHGALLDAALSTLARRIQFANQRVASLAQGREAAPVRSEPALLARLWRSLVPGQPKEPCPELLPLIQGLPGLGDAAPDVLKPLEAAFVAEPMEEGKPLFLEGETASSAFLVALGTVDVLRHVRGDRAERLATLKPGDLLGINTLIQVGPRTASCVSVGRGWLYRLDATAYEGLTGDTRLWWRESMLGALAIQLRLSNQALRRDLAQRQQAVAGDGFKELLAASGFLEGLPVGEDALAQIEVVLTEDTKRNRRPPGR
ncbi:MAG: cyclic nucleotide-binding domain-containing protein [Myxococcales bacterium]|nr:cyclic nucleotide-binding domain-containing protein [Myxococcales bacterium]